MQVLLGRSPLRLPTYAPHVAKRLGLVAPAVGGGIELVWKHSPFPVPVDDTVRALSLYSHGWCYNPFTHGLRAGSYWDPITVAPVEPAPFTLAALSRPRIASAAAVAPASEDVDVDTQVALASMSALDAFRAGLLVAGLDDAASAVPSTPDVIPRSARPTRARDLLSVISSVVAKPTRPPPSVKRRHRLRSAPKEWHDSGRIAALWTGARVHVNLGPVEGRTPLLSACEK